MSKQTARTVLIMSGASILLALTAIGFCLYAVMTTTDWPTSIAFIALFGVNYWVLMQASNAFGSALWDYQNPEG